MKLLEVDTSTFRLMAMMGQIRWYKHGGWMFVPSFERFLLEYAERVIEAARLERLPIQECFD